MIPFTGHRKQTLTYSLSRAFFAVSAGALLFATLIDTAISLKSQADAIADNQQRIAERAAAEVNTFVLTKFRALETTIGLSNLSSATEASQKLILDRLIGQDKAFRKLTLYDEHNQERAGVSRRSRHLTSDYPEHIKQQLFKQGSQGANRYISPVMIDGTTNEPVVVMAVAVENIFGERNGLLVAETNLKHMWDVVGGLEVGDNGTAYVVDKEGHLLAAEDIGFVLRGDNLSQLAPVKRFMHSSGDAEGRNEIDISDGLAGNLVVATYTPLGLPD